MWGETNHHIKFNGPSKNVLIVSNLKNPCSILTDNKKEVQHCTNLYNKLIGDIIIENCVEELQLPKIDNTTINEKKSETKNVFWNMYVEHS